MKMPAWITNLVKKKAEPNLSGEKLLENALKIGKTDSGALAFIIGRTEGYEVGSEKERRIQEEKRVYARNRCLFCIGIIIILALLIRLFSKNEIITFLLILIYVFWVLITAMYAVKWNDTSWTSSAMFLIGFGILLFALDKITVENFATTFQSFLEGIKP